MLFNHTLKIEIDTNYQNACLYFGDYRNEIDSYIAHLNDEEAYGMKFIYGNLPLSDISDCPIQTIHSYVTHSLFVRKQMPWGSKIPVDLFLSDVLFPRINTEKLEDCRKLLFDMTNELIHGKNMYDAVLEVNYWCLEQATYQSTDIRTSSPLTVLNRAYGRCGEESTFTVSALRSLGIPARQIYTPRWAHCDDNHAWTEAWCDGTWHYLGACEPTPALDQGWFTSASARAMFLYSRTFYKDMDCEQKIWNEGPTATINHISSYAKSTSTKVIVVKEGNPVKGAKVIFEILNFSEMAPLCTLYTDDKGEAIITSGIGSLNVHVVYDGISAEVLIHTAETNEITIDLIQAAKDSITFDVKGTDFDMQAPSDAGRTTSAIPSDELKIHQERLKECNRLRQRKEESFLNYDRSGMNADNAYDSACVDDILFQAKGNASNVLLLLNFYGRFSYELLKILTEKDYTDLNPDILGKHIEHAMKYSECCDGSTYLNYILNPRIHYENITDFRHFIDDFFSPEEAVEFVHNPPAIWDYICNNIEYKPEKEYDNIFTSPEGVLRMKKGSPISQSILFVAICRTFGIPARLNPEDYQVEYMHEGIFCSPLTKEAKKCRLIVNADENEDWVYLSNWSLAILENGCYKTLELNGKPSDLKNIFISSGTYRLITANRLPNGNLYARKYTFPVKEGDENTIDIKLRQYDLNDMLIHIRLNDASFFDLNDEACALHSLLVKKNNLLLWLGENEEPTEHILNEIGEQQELFEKLDCGITFILKDKSAMENSNISRILNMLPKIQVCFDKNFELQEPIARNLYVAPDQLPLVVIINDSLTAVYASSGYNVGLAGLINQIITMV